MKALLIQNARENCFDWGLASSWNLVKVRRGIEEDFLCSFLRRQ